MRKALAKAASVSKKSKRKSKGRPDRGNTHPSSLGLENYKHPDKFGEWLGYKITHIDYKRNIAKASLRVREDHLSPAARVHGGVISAFIDFVCGAAVFSSMQRHDYASTVELKVNYLRPVELGDLLVAQSKV